MMNKLFVILLGTLLLISCDTPENNKMDDPKAALKGKYFFEFDEIIHYQSEIDEDELMFKQDNLTTKEKSQRGLLFNDKPKSIADTSFVKNMNNLGYVENIVSAKKYDDINELFREVDLNTISSFVCSVIFKDILVFKNNNAIVGIAKICFSCNHHHIIGTKAVTITFGQNGEFGVLNELLNQE